VRLTGLDAGSEVGFGQSGDAGEVHEGDSGIAWTNTQVTGDIIIQSHRYELYLPRPTVRNFLIAIFVSLIVPTRAHAMMDCGQANPAQTRAIFEQGEYARGANPTHTRYKSALATITEHADHTCIAPFPLYSWENTPAGTLTAQLEIVYIVCVPSGPPPWRARPEGTPGTCPYIHLKGYPAV